MSALALEEPLTSSEPLLSDRDAKIRKTCMEWIKEGKKARLPFEAPWQQNLAFAAGNPHLKYDRAERKLYLPDLAKGEERTSADKIMQYRNTALGELTGDDDRPELQFAQDDLPSEEYAKTANFAVEYGWECEWFADQRLEDMKRTIIDLGTAAIRTRWDPTAGPIKVGVPHKDGKPIFDMEEAHAYVAEQQAQGLQAEFRDIHEGRTVLDVLTPLHLLVPPGIPNEENFPWEIVVWPEQIEKLKEQYGAKAAGLVEDTDIASVFALGATGDTTDIDAQQGKLKDHVWAYACYRRPGGKYPKGQQVILASNSFHVLEVRDELSYKGPDGTHRSGVTYFHWWRITGRFLGKALLDGLKDPQRSINRRITQKNEIIDRGMPYGVAEEGSIPPRTGKPMEMLYVKKGSPKPDMHEGIGSGEYMYRDIDSLKQDMEEAAGIRAVSMGDNPASVTNYSQLLLLRQNDQIKLKPTIRGIRGGVKQVVENCVHDIGLYWGSEKMLRLAGDDGMARTALFNATQLPAFYLVKTAKGDPKPHDQVGNLRMVEDIARHSIDSGQPLPTSWYADSLKAGVPLPIPEAPADDQHSKALYENHFMIEGQEPEVDYWDNALVHIPEHRSLEDQATLSGDQELADRVERHIQKHLAAEMAKAAGQGDQGGPPDAGAPVAAGPGPPPLAPAGQ